MNSEQIAKITMLWALESLDLKMNLEIFTFFYLTKP